MIASVQTPYGLVSRDEFGTVKIVATQAELYDWAHRLDASWPCSALADTEDTLTVVFDRWGDLLDITGDSEDLTSDELAAWSDDVREIASTVVFAFAR
jgi:hypothetical protein